MSANSLHAGKSLGLALAVLAAASWTSLAPTRATAATFTTIHAFTGPDGISPVGVIGNGAGNLYGAAEYGGGPAGCDGCGDVYVLDPAGELTVLLDFPQGSTGKNPGNALTLIGPHLIGATTIGSSSGTTGSVYTLLRNGYGVRAITFDGTDGGNPAIATLRVDRNGDVFGVTQYGGPDYVQGEANGDGTLFEVTLEGALTVLHQFSGPDGQEPNGLVLAGTTLYGSTLSGGACSHPTGCGTVFSLDLANGNAFATLYDFPVTAKPIIAGVDTAGNIYGVTSYGGTSDTGTIFELELVDGSYQYELLHSFSRSTAYPAVAPLLTNAGHLVGVTPGGEVSGTEYGGVLYDYAVGAGTFTTLYVLPTGIQPNSTPYIDKAGAIYGTTLYGGDVSCTSAGCGTVWKYTR